MEGNPEREVQTDVASVRTQLSTHACCNCGGRHAPGRASCPVKAMPCHACKKIGHLKKFCKSVKKREVKGEVTSLVLGAITLASVCINKQPIVGISVSYNNKTVAYNVVPDTGAQVCIAGTPLMSALNLRPALLQRRAGLRDVANLQLRCLGSAPVAIAYRGVTTVKDVYFVGSAKSFYISLSACRELGLVHTDFPRHTHVVGVANIVSVSDSAATMGDLQPVVGRGRDTPPPP